MYISKSKFLSSFLETTVLFDYNVGDNEVQLKLHSQYLQFMSNEMIM